MNLKTFSTTKVIGGNTPFFSDDRIFLGEGLFETIRVVQQRPCYPQLHWHRMRSAAAALAIPFDLSSDMWYQALVDCIKMAKLNTGGIKVILSGGRAPRGLDAYGSAPSLVFDAFTYQSHRQALRLVSAPWLRDASNPIYQLKSVNYLESILARRQASAVGADDALFFNLEHHVTDTTVANLFIVKKEQLMTPLTENGVLAGIIRERILSLSQKVGISSTQKSINHTMVTEADAVFVTNSLQGIRSVKSIDGHDVPIRHPLVNLLKHLLATDEMRWG